MILLTYLSVATAGAGHWHNNATLCGSVGPTKVPITVTQNPGLQSSVSSWPIQFGATTGLVWTPEEQAAVADSLSQWSDDPTSSLAGVLPFAFVLPPLDPIAYTVESSAQDFLCNGTNEVVWVSGAEWQSGGGLETLCGDPSGATVLGCGLRMVTSVTGLVVEIDLFLNANTPFAIDQMPTSSAQTSLRQVVLHEGGHLVGVRHDKHWPLAQRPLAHTMDVQYPSGGNYGNDDNGGVVRVSALEVAVWATDRGGVLNPGYANLMIKRYRGAHGDPSDPTGWNANDNAIELWTTPHSTEHDADWTHDFCEEIGWPEPGNHIDEPSRAFYPVSVEVVAPIAPGTSTGILADVKYYLKLPGEACGASDLYMGLAHVNPDPSRVRPC